MKTALGESTDPGADETKNAVERMAITHYHSSAARTCFAALLHWVV
jgi:hypothetical protein